MKAAASYGITLMSREGNAYVRWNDNCEGLSDGVRPVTRVAPPAPAVTLTD